MNNTLEGFINDNLITDENKDDVLYFEYSEKAAKQFGYHTAILNDGKRINFTSQTTGDYNQDYMWKDKVQFEPVKRIDISQWQYDNFLSMESKMSVVMSRMLQQEMNNRMRNYGNLSSGFNDYNPRKYRM